MCPGLSPLFAVDSICTRGSRPSAEPLVLGPAIPDSEAARMMLSSPGGGGGGVQQQQRSDQMLVMSPYAVNDATNDDSNGWNRGQHDSTIAEDEASVAGRSVGGMNPLFESSTEMPGRKTTMRVPPGGGGGGVAAASSAASPQPSATSRPLSFDPSMFEDGARNAMQSTGL